MQYIYLGILAVVLLFFLFFAFLMVLIFFVALIEKQSVKLFVDGTIDGLGEYYNRMRAAAESEGFVFSRSGRDIKNKPVSASLLRSPDNKSIAVIINGKEYGFTVKRTWIISQLSDQSFLITSDQLGQGELDPWTYRTIMKGAGFMLLYARHQERIASYDSVILFPDQVSWDNLDAIEQTRANRAAYAKMIRFCDIQGLYYRCTIKGALRNIQNFRSFTSYAIAEAEVRRNQSKNNLLKR